LEKGETMWETVKTVYLGEMWRKRATEQKISQYLRLELIKKLAKHED
jgi:hypothetical protein